MNKSQLFSTPVFSHTIETDDLNERLVDAVGALMSENPESPVKRSNMGGWHSDVTIFEPERMNKLGRHGEAIKDLGEQIHAFFINCMDDLVEDGETWSADVDMSGWFNVLRDESWNSPHTHPGSSWSFIYYVDTAAADEEEGCIVFEDPRGGAVQHPSTPGVFPQGKHSVPARDGMIVMFPSWLKHYVTPYYDDDLRIGVSGNIVLQNVESSNNASGGEA